MRTFGLIPAAGQSRRMGQPKLLLPLGNKTVLEGVIAAVRAAGVDKVLVVVAPEAEELAARAEAAEAEVLRLDQETPDMRASCAQGLRWIEQNWQPRDEDGWLLLPADHPTLQPDVVRALLAAAAQLAAPSIIVPTCNSRRGHPTWLRWSHVAGLEQFPTEQGLNAFIRQREGETFELPWSSEDILHDLDTPADYQRLLARENGSK